MKSLNQITVQDIKEWANKIERKTWIKIGVSVGVGVFLMIFVVWPAWISRIGVKAEVKEHEAQIAEVEGLAAKKPALLKAKGESQQFISEVKSRIFNIGETSLLLGSISKLADESKVSIIASSPRSFLVQFPEPFNQQYEANLYDFTVEGGYHAIGDFVSRIENNPKLLRIQDFNIQPSQDDPTTHLINLSVSAVSLKDYKPVPQKPEKPKKNKKKKKT